MSGKTPKVSAKKRSAKLSAKKQSAKTPKAAPKRSPVKSPKMSFAKSPSYDQLTILPDEMVFDILLHLPHNDLVRACASSQRLANICNDTKFRQDRKKLQSGMLFDMENAVTNTSWVGPVGNSTLNINFENGNSLHMLYKNNKITVVYLIIGKLTIWYYNASPEIATIDIMWDGKKIYLRKNFTDGIYLNMKYKDLAPLVEETLNNLGLRTQYDQSKTMEDAIAQIKRVLPAEFATVMN